MHREIIAARIHDTIVIKRAIEDVFAYLSDVRSNLDYRAGVISIELTSPEPQRVGSTFRFTVKVMGEVLETTGEVTGFEPPTSYAWRSTSGPFPMCGSMALLPAEGGTRLTYEIEAEPGGFFTLAQPLLSMQPLAQLEADMHRARQILERGA